MPDKKVTKNRICSCLLIIIIYSTILSVKGQDTIGAIPLPADDFIRYAAEPGSFADWLRQLPIKAAGNPVLDYRGRIFKAAGDTSIGAVVDLDIGGRRLEQCMDIVVRLYADYLWSANKARGLGLPLPGGYELYWQDWKYGIRPFFKGLVVSFRKSDAIDSTAANYQKYLNTIYAESHTQQFYYAYEPLHRTDVAIGDFIVKKGTKGHAVMIVDLAKDDQGHISALIGNGDTPACQFFLINHKREQIWVPLKFNQENIELSLRRSMSWDGLRRFSRRQRER